MFVEFDHILKHIYNINYTVFCLHRYLVVDTEQLRLPHMYLCEGRGSIHDHHNLLDILALSRSLVILRARHRRGKSVCPVL